MMKRFELKHNKHLAMDPLMEKYYPMSPYVYCGNNPVSFVDPDGRAYTDPLKLLIEHLLADIKDNIREQESQIHQLEIDQKRPGLSDEEREEIGRGIISARSIINEFRNVQKEIQFLRESSQIYHVLKVLPRDNNNDYGYVKPDNELGYIGIYLSNDKNSQVLIHELKHLCDFEMGNLSFSKNENGAPFYDIQDEISAYARQSLLFNAAPWDEDLARSSEYVNIQQGPKGLSDVLPRAVQYFPEMYIQRIANSYQATIRYHGKTYTPKK